MAKIIAIDGRVRAANRRLVTDALGAPCCCVDVGRLYIFRECCDNLPRFVVTQAVRDELIQRCSLTLGSFPTILVRQQGSNTCYSLDITTAGTITREDAIRAGYPIIEDAQTLECVDRTRPDLQPNNCFASPTQCRPCPRQCCLTHIYRKNCPDIHVADALPKANICCSYGSRARRIYRHEMRYQRENYLTLNTAAIPDPWCPYTGCLQELFGERVSTQRNEEDISLYIACPDVLPPNNRRHVCESYSLYTRDTSTTRRWAFAAPRPTDTNCLQYEDTVNDQENRNNDCGPDGGLIPSGFPRRMGRIARRRPECDVYAIGAGDPVCDDIDVTCVIGDVNDQAYTTERLIYRYGVSCTTGSAYYRLERETRSGRQIAGPCQPDKLIARETMEMRWSYSIQILDRRDCPTNICDGYARSGSVSTFPVGPGLVTPTEGAFLFL